MSTPTPTAAGCELLSVTVTAFSPNGEKGPPASTEVTTAYGRKSYIYFSIYI